MYPHVFPPQWIMGFWYKFFHPPLFRGINENWYWEESCGLKRLGERAYGRGTRGERLPVTMLKVVSTTFLLVYFVSLKGSTREIRKNVFYFTLKALFILEIIKF